MLKTHTQQSHKIHKNHKGNANLFYSGRFSSVACKMLPFFFLLLCWNYKLGENLDCIFFFLDVHIHVCLFTSFGFETIKYFFIIIFYFVIIIIAVIIMNCLQLDRFIKRTKKKFKQGLHYLLFLIFFFFVLFFMVMNLILYKIWMCKI